MLILFHVSVCCIPFQHWKFFPKRKKFWSKKGCPIWAWVHNGTVPAHQSEFQILPLCHLHQIRSVAQSCPTLHDPMNRSTPGLPVHHQLPEFTETHVHQVSDAIQPSHPPSSPSPPAPNPSQHQSLSQWVNSSHEVAKIVMTALNLFRCRPDLSWLHS